MAITVKWLGTGLGLVFHWAIPKKWILVNDLSTSIYWLVVSNIFLFSFRPNSLPAGKRCRPKVGCAWSLRFVCNGLGRWGHSSLLGMASRGRSRCSWWCGGGHHIPRCGERPGLAHPMWHPSEGFGRNQGPIELHWTVHFRCHAAGQRALHGFRSGRS